MVGALVGAGLGIVGSIWGGAKASAAARKAKAEVEAQRRRNEAWFDRRFHEDGTQRADAQRLLNITQENIRRRNRNAQGVQAVMGGTDASLASEREANNQALASTLGSINAQNEARKDAIEQQYRNIDQHISHQLVGIEQARANATAQATAGVLSAAGSIASAGLGDKTSKLK